jgi:uncharacterized membrane protein YdbT with pleckstrin-like domain
MNTKGHYAALTVFDLPLDETRTPNRVDMQQDNVADSTIADDDPVRITQTFALGEILVALQLAGLILKLTFINWWWWVVLMPLWLPAALLVLALAGWEFAHRASKIRRGLWRAHPRY